jgi:hypothetical protein
MNYVLNAFQKKLTIGKITLLIIYKPYHINVSRWMAEISMPLMAIRIVKKLNETNCNLWKPSLAGSEKRKRFLKSKPSLYTY